MSIIDYLTQQSFNFPDLGPLSEQRSQRFSQTFSLLMGKLFHLGSKLPEGLDSRVSVLILLQLLLSITCQSGCIALGVSKVTVLLSCHDMSLPDLTALYACAYYLWH